MSGSGAGEGGWLRVERIDGAALVAEVNARTGAGLAYEGPLPGGNVGAAAATRADGSAAVVTWWAEGVLARWPTIRAVLDRLHAVGYPAPAIEVVPLDGGAAVVQDRVAGVPVRRPTPELVRRLLALNDRQADLLDAPAGRTPELYLTGDGPGFCLHEPMRRHSARTRALLDWVEEVGRALPPAAVAGRDAVHFDFHLDNVLVHRDDPDRVAGVVDWTGAAFGDRHLDLVTLGMDLTVRGEPTALVEERLRGVAPDRLAAYVAHLALRFVDWAIRHHGEAEVAAWTAAAERWRAAVGA